MTMLDYLRPRDGESRCTAMLNRARCIRAEHDGNGHVYVALHGAADTEQSWDDAPNVSDRGDPNKRSEMN